MEQSYKWGPPGFTAESNFHYTDSKVTWKWSTSCTYPYLQRGHRRIVRYYKMIIDRGNGQISVRTCLCRARQYKYKRDKDSRERAPNPDNSSVHCQWTLTQHLEFWCTYEQCLHCPGLEVADMNSEPLPLVPQTRGMLRNYPICSRASVWPRVLV